MEARFGTRRGVRAVTFGALLLSAPGAARGNLLTNPGFDQGGGSFAGWITFGNAFVETAVSRSAPASGKMFGNFSGGFNVTGMFQPFPASAGEIYTLDAYSFIGSFDPIGGSGPPNDNWAVMKIAFFNAPAGGSEIGSAEQIIASGTFPQDVWIDNPAVVAVAPLGTQRVEAFFLFLQPAFAGGSVFVDDASFTPEPTSLAILGIGALAVVRRRRSRP